MTALLAMWLLAQEKEGRVTENWPNGKTKTSATYKEGKLHGPFLEYYESGRKRVEARYAQGELDGSYMLLSDKGRDLLACKFKKGRLEGKFTALHENGKPWLSLTFAAGEPTGALVSVGDDGIAAQGPVQARPEKEVRSTIAQIRQGLEASGDFYLEEPSTSEAMKAGKIAPAHLQAGLAQVKGYRFLVGLPYADLSINEGYCKEAQHGAVLLAKMGRLDHTPSKPSGVPDDFFKVAYAGASKSNLFMWSGSPDPVGFLIKAVDGWMDDSSASSIADLGHRRWILNPAMKQTGFGTFEGFAALWSMDASQAKIPDYDAIAFPPKGAVPVEYFKDRWAWSVTLNPNKYETPEEGKVQASIRLFEDLSRGVPEALELDTMSVSTRGYGIANCIIFRPKEVAVEAGRRYLVEIEGVQAKGRKPARIAYLVSFIKLD